MRAIVELSPNLEDWVSEDLNLREVSLAVRLLQAESVACFKNDDLQKYQNLRNLSEKSKRVAEIWLSSTPRFGVIPKYMTPDLSINEFMTKGNPLSDLVGSDSFLRWTKVRSSSPGEDEGPEELFNRMFTPIMQTCKHLVLADKWFGLNSYRPRSGTAFFLNKLKTHKVSADIYTSASPGGKKINLDSIKALGRDSNKDSGISIKIIEGEMDFLHDRIGYFRLFRGRIFFRLGKGAETFSRSSNGAYPPRSVGEEKPHDSFDAYIRSREVLEEFFV